MTFQKLVSDFTSITPTQASDLLATQENHILFLGRASCPFCNRFIPKLHQVVQENNLTVYFLDTSFVSPELQDLRERYHVPTVPGLIYAGKDEVKVRCDSSMSQVEIAEFVKL